MAGPGPGGTGTGLTEKPLKEPEQRRDVIPLKPESIPRVWFGAADRASGGQAVATIQARVSGSLGQGGGGGGPGRPGEGGVCRPGWWGAVWCRERGLGDSGAVLGAEPGSLRAGRKAEAGGSAGPRV